MQALGSESELIRDRAARVLGKIGARAAVEPLIQTINEDDLVRVKAVRALAMIGDAKSSAKTLIQALNDKSNEVQKAAKEALEQLREIKKFYSTLRKNVNYVNS
ncbi:HEAT repeat domain-containing protein [Caldisericum sp. AR60]|uniref:HEAT repeat domain-containing protein n=1 Tax=Caldisericum sp. AR60 TaxID=3397852 RepID=UPI0039FBD486